MMNEELNKQIKKYLELSDSLRKNYSKSLGITDVNNIRELSLPDALDTLYSMVKGTFYEIENQSLMDFIPGFLLIHISEYDEFKEKLTKKVGNGKDIYIPILVNYSSDFYAIKLENRKDVGIYLVNHDELEPIKIHNSFEIFINTLISFYEEEVYFLDEDGYLDMDFEKEEEVGQKLNPDISFWVEG